MAGLTDVKVRSAKSPERITKLSDGGGLQLWVTPAGGKHWKLAYRFDGKQKKLPIGPYPQIGLADARDRREVAKRLLARGIDPLAHERATKDAEEKAAAVTFRLVAGELVERKEREERAASTLVKTRWLLDFAYPDIGDRPITEIKPADVLAVLRKVEVRGRLESARRLRSVIGEVFRYAIATARAEHDPTGPLKGALLSPKPKHRAALVDRKALGAMLRAIDGYDGQPVTRHALKLLAVLFPRPGELRLAHWNEFDRDKAIWTIPAARTKMRRPHRVPLPKQALEVLRDLHKLTGYGKLVFPGVGRGSRAGLPVEPRPISENTLNALQPCSTNPASGTLTRSSAPWPMSKMMTSAAPMPAASTGTSGSAWRSGGLMSSTRCAASEGTYDARRSAAPLSSAAEGLGSFEPSH